MAQTLTSKLKLAKHDTGDLNWGADANANADALDAHVQQATLRPPRTLLATLGSGAVGANLLGSTTYFYKVTAINAVGETTEGQIPAVVEAQVTEPSTPLPVILQWETVSGATGYKIYKATASGQEQFLAQVTGQATSTYTDTGNTATTSTTVPTSNTARTSVTQIVAGANVTVSPADGTGAVTVAATASTPPAASDTVQGDTKLSVAPAVAGNPIAVGVNDPSVTNARTPTGAAGGDLSGTYPNPSVAKVNGTSVPASPSAGQVLTATSPSAAAWQAPTGGGYATAVVAVPSGTAATDTTNIQSAIDSVSAAGGGTVILREGIYQISTTINPKSGVTIRGQGKSTVQNTGLSGTSGGGSPSGTTLRGTTGLGSTKMIADPATAPINVTFRDLNLDFGKVTRGSITGQDMVMHGSNLTFINVTFIMLASVGNPSVDITPTNINDIGKNKFIGCDFYDAGTAATVAFQLDGQITECYFEGTVATFSELLNFFSGSITNCYFASNKVYNTGIIHVQPNNNGPQTVAISNCYFKQYTTTQTTAISVDNITNGNVVISGNVADSTNVGNIRVFSSSGLRNVIGNVGFASYSGGNQNGNDGQAAINSGGAAGGDLSGTYPNPTVAKVNGTSVPASPSAGQVLTATSPTAAAWQTPAGGGGYATVVVAAPTGVAATDTANINSALSSVATNGGTIILREGTYVVNATLSPASNVTIMGQGRGATIIKADAGLGSNSLFNVASGSTQVTIQDLKLNFNFSVRGTIASVNDMTIIGAGFKMLRVWAVGHTAGSGASAFSMVNNTSVAGNMVIDNCKFDVFGDNGSQGPTCGNGYIAANSLLVSGSMFRTFSGDIVLITANTTGSSNLGFISVIGNEFYSIINNITDMVKVVTGIVANNRFSSSVTVTRSISTAGFSASQVVASGNCALNGSTNNGAITIGGTNTSATGNVGFSSYTASVTAANS